MTAPEIQMLPQLVTERMLNSIPGGLLIAAFAWLLLRVVGRQNSGTRFAVWFSALLAIAGLAFVPGLSHSAHAMRAEITLPWFWAVAIFAAWVLFTALAATRVLIGLWSLRRLRRSGLELLPSQLHPVLRDTLVQCQATRPVTVRCSSAASVPTAIGFFKPVILIPEWALRDLPAEELKIILLHEFAHLRRWDDWTNLAQKIVRTVFFFHPAVWWIEKRLSLEREMACDDAVLAETGNPGAYAKCLVSIAEKSFLQRSMAMAQAAIGRARETSLRVAQILDEDRPYARGLFKPALGLMTACAALCLILLPNAPRLIAFENAAEPGSSVMAKAMVERSQVPVVPVIFRTSVGAVHQMGPSELAAVPQFRHPQYRQKVPALKADRNFSTQPIDSSRKQPGLPVLPVSAKQSTPAPEFLFVMQAAEFSDQGSVVLSVRMWRVTFASPNPNPTHEGVTAKKI